MAADDWVTVPAATAPAGVNDWATAGATTEAPKSDKSAILDFFEGLRRGGVQSLANTAAANGNAAAIEMGQPDTTPDAATVFDELKKNVTGDLGTASGKAGEYGETIGDTLANPLSWFGPGGIVGKTATGAASAIGAKLFGDVAKGSPFESVAPFLGGFVGGGTPSTLARLITPFTAEATRLGLVNTLKKEGVPVTAGEKTGNMGLRYVENYLKPDLNEPQAEAYTKAALSRAGINAERATPEVMDKAFNRLDDQFNIAKGYNLQNDAELGHGMKRVVGDYNAEVVDPAKRNPLISNTVNTLNDKFLAQSVPPGVHMPSMEYAYGGKSNLAAAFPGGGMTGEEYQTLRSQLARAARNSDDPAAAHAARELTGVLDDAMARSIKAVNPADYTIFDRAQNQYRNMLVLEKAAGGAAPGTAAGLITPAQLASATKTIQGTRNYVRGQGDFADLARAGQGVLKPLPDSGTAWRNRLTKAVQGASVGLGTLIGGQHFGSPVEGGVLGLLLAENLGEPILRQGLKHAIMNPVSQAYLGNQVLPHVPGLLSTAPLQPFAAGMAGGGQ
jgi:hypothetical protein